MSRFYDALKQASRFHRSVNPGAEQEPWEPFGIESVTVVPTAPTSPKPDDLLEAPAPVRPDPWKVTADPSRMQTAQLNVDIGTDATVDIERSARVIPNIADHVVVEHYRRLRTKLIQQHAARPFRTLLVTSPNPQEGKTVTTLNLALSFAMVPTFRVLVVDGDLRRGTLGKWLQVGDRPGLSNLIEGSALLDDVVLRCEQIPVHFMVSGNARTPPAELLHTPNLGDQFTRIAEHFDVVLVDSPPVNLITDTQLLAAHCDAVLLVARAFSTSSKSLEKAVQDLSAFRMVGTVLNGGTRVRAYGRGRGYY